jgi:hypothetical protein
MAAMTGSRYPSILSGSPVLSPGSLRRIGRSQFQLQIRSCGVQVQIREMCYPGLFGIRYTVLSQIPVAILVDDELGLAPHALAERLDVDEFEQDAGEAGFFVLSSDGLAVAGFPVFDDVVG